MPKVELSRNATAVFTGTAARVDDHGSRRVVNFDVDTVYKGPVSPSIDVTTGLGGGDCGVGFVVDRRYTVLAAGASDALVASICGGNPVLGDLDPTAYGLGPGSTGLHRPVTGLHRPLSPWLIVFTVLAAGVVVFATAKVARRQRSGSGGTG